MDNELVNNEVITEAAEKVDIKSMTKQALPIAAGIGIGVIGGCVLYRFVINPIIAKLQNKKTNVEEKPADGESQTEES